MPLCGSNTPSVGGREELDVPLPSWVQGRASGGKPAKQRGERPGLRRALGGVTAPVGWERGQAAGRAGSPPLGDVLEHSPGSGGGDAIWSSDR